MSVVDESRIESLLSEMSLEEKVALCHASGNFTSGKCERLGIPPITMSDGPHAVRHELDPHSWEQRADFDDRCTYLPTGTAVAATWNPEMARLHGRVLGAEARDRGKDIILGPGVNILRTPLCGRNFEYYSEDPFLASSLVVEEVAGIQEQDTACCVKHYALNNQELDRHGVDVVVDERTLREIYLPAFRAAVEAGAWSFMGAYNLYQGQHCCHNRKLLNEILKNEWGFDGVVVSDWGGTYDTVEAATCGLDIEMGGGSDYEKYHMAKPMFEAVQAGKVSESDINDKVRRILRLMFRVGLIDGTGRKSGARNTPEHRRAALSIAREAVVLIRNEGGFLPLRKDRLRRLAVIGENAVACHAEGGGSSTAPAAYEISPLDGLRDLLGDDVEITYVQGYPIGSGSHKSIEASELGVVEEGAGVRGWKAEYFDNRHFGGEPVAMRTVQSVDFGWSPADGGPAGTDPANFSVKFTSSFTPEESGPYEFALEGVDCCQLKLDDVPIISNWGRLEPSLRTATVELDSGRAYRIEVNTNPKAGQGWLRLGWLKPSDERPDLSGAMDQSLEAARQADAVLFIGGLNHSFDTEGSDRTELGLHGGQDQLIEALAEANPNLAVVIVSGSPVSMPWLSKVPGVVWSPYNGMEAGRALAEVLLGQVNPSGKLPFTVPASLKDSPAHALDAYRPHRCEYKEGLLVGYRWFDAKGIEPDAAFGHGLSYTRFTYRNMEIQPGQGDEKVWVSLTLSNDGSVAGTEVVQLYAGQPGRAEHEPVRELKGFTKVHLKPGESRAITFGLSDRNLSGWDSKQGGWTVQNGEWEFAVGSSSRDLRLHSRLRV